MGGGGGLEAGGFLGKEKEMYSYKLSLACAKVGVDTRGTWSCFSRLTRTSKQ